MWYNQSLIGIDIEIGSEDISSIPRNCNRRGLEPLDTRIDPRIRTRLRKTD
jgi:hypothetical protein